ncbi:MAG: hypothetical protein FJ030_04755 [Chloroflexi bacterium]|nr:hypothetical protein [Chloroflexota bacterium]
MQRLLVRVFILALALAACASGNTAPQAIEAYLTAIVAKDSNAVINASCSTWEESAKLELDSFAAVTPTLEGLACEAAGTDGDFTLVTCKGKIKVTYNNELQELPLEGRTYLAAQDGGEWRMCGYK